MRRRGFSLIEIMIVLTILTMVAGFVGRSIYSLIEEGKSRRDSELFLARLRIAKSLVAIERAEIMCHVAATPPCISYWFESENSIPLLPKTKTKLCAFATIETKGKEVSDLSFPILSPKTPPDIIFKSLKTNQLRLDLSSAGPMFVKFDK